MFLALCDKYTSTQKPRQIETSLSRLLKLVRMSEYVVYGSWVHSKKTISLRHKL